MDSNGFGGNPLAGKANVTLDDLSNYDWIVGTPGAIRRIHFEKLFEGRPTVRLLTAKSLPRFRSAVRPVYSA